MTEKKLSIRFKSELYEEIKARCAAKHTTESEFIRSCVEKQLGSDLEIQNELVSTIGNFRSELFGVKREIKIFSNLFVYWLKYYFTLSGADFDALPDGGAKTLAFGKGEARRNKFIEMYKLENKEYKALFEQIFADFMTEKQNPQEPEKKA